MAAAILAFFLASGVEWKDIRAAKPGAQQAQQAQLSESDKLVVEKDGEDSVTLVQVSQKEEAHVKV
jgi:hypothetical protein